MLIIICPLTAWHRRSAGDNAVESNQVPNMVMVKRIAFIEVNVESCQWTSKPLQMPNLARRLLCRHPQEPRQRPAVRLLVIPATSKGRGKNGRLFGNADFHPAQALHPLPNTTQS